MTLVRNVVDLIVADAAVANTNDLAEVFTITPTKGPDKMVIIISVANTHGTVACSLGAGALHTGQSAAQTFNAVQNATSIFHVCDLARFMTAAGTILLTLTPAGGKKLQSEHVATVAVIELP
jgi:hypothetical protein